MLIYTQFFIYISVISPFDQVIYADFDDNNVLGYLPRELAQYLSPLIDMFDLTFEVLGLCCCNI